MSAPNQEHWKVDKKVPMALIATIIVAFTAQTFGFGFWAATTTEQLRAATARLDQVEKRLEAAAPQAVAIAEVRVKVDALTSSVSEIKDILRQRPQSR